MAVFVFSVLWIDLRIQAQYLTVIFFQTTAVRPAKSTAAARTRYVPGRLIFEFYIHG